MNQIQISPNGRNAFTVGRGNSTRFTNLPVTPPAPPGVFFQSNWSTALGNSVNAYQDGGAWTQTYCSGADQVLNVVDGSTVGWTKTPNVLRIRQFGTQCGNLEAVDAIPLSTSHYGRFYFRNDETTSRHNHAVTYFPVGTIQTALWNRNGYANGVNIRMRFYYQSDGNPTSVSGPAPNQWTLSTGSSEILLSNATWYRYEWHMEYVTPTTYRLWPRVYEMDGTVPLYTADNYYANEGALQLSAFYAGGGTWGFSDVELARNFGLGNEGPASGAESGEYWYHAALALATGGWIGGI